MTKHLPPFRPGNCNEELGFCREYWRWHFAGLLMQGFAARPKSLLERGPTNPAAECVREADLLIDELEKDTD